MPVKGSTLVGDALGVAIVLGITTAALVTTVVGTMRARDALKRRGWSELARAWALLGIGLVLFGVAGSSLTSHGESGVLGVSGGCVGPRRSGPKTRPPRCRKDRLTTAAASAGRASETSR